MSIRSVSAALCGILVAAGLALAHPPATETGFIQVEPDVRLFYQRFGTGTPRIFFPTRTESIVSYAPLLESLDVVMWDARGFGLSDRPDDMSRYGLEYELADAEAIRRHFGAERIYYVGGSLWGNVAMLYAARHPEAVAGVVALGPLAIQAALMGESDDPIVHDLSAEIAELEAMVADGRKEQDPYGYCVADYRVGFADAYVDLANFERFEAANVCQYANWHPERIGPVAFDGVIGSFGDWDWREELATVQAPVLLIYGDREAWPLAGVRAYTEVVPDIGWVEFENVGHHVWNERNDEVLALMTGFFEGRWVDGVHRR